MINISIYKTFIYINNDKKKLYKIYKFYDKKYLYKTHIYIYKYNYFKNYC